MEKTRDTEQIKEFYHAIFFRHQKIDGYLALFTKSNKKTHRVLTNDPDGFAALTASLGSSMDVHFNLAIQNFDLAEKLYQKKNPGEKYAGRGNELSAKYMTCIYGDIDVVAAQHSQSDLPTSLDEAMSLLKLLPVLPSIIVFSGHGLHFYILFEQALDISIVKGREAFKALSAALQNFIITNGMKRGWKLDNVGDVARLLRPPGTINYKDPNNPVPVKIIELHEDRVYSFDFLNSKFGVREKTVQVTSYVKNNKVSGENYKEYFAENIIENCLFIAHCKVDSQNLPEPEWFAMINILAKCENGISAIHELSQDYKNYSCEETDSKIEYTLANYSPRTCKSVSELTGGKYCGNCLYNEKN